MDIFYVSFFFFAFDFMANRFKQYGLWSGYLMLNFFCHLSLTSTTFLGRSFFPAVRRLFLCTALLLA